MSLFADSIPGTKRRSHKKTGELEAMPAGGIVRQKKPVLLARNLFYRIQPSLSIHIPELEVYPGEVLGVLGPNGAGKTTLLNLLAGSLTPHEGEILLHDRPIENFSAHKLASYRSVVRASAEYTGSGLTAREVIELGALNNPLNARLLHVLTSCYAASLALSSRLDTDFSLLSSGEKKRTEFARALVQVFGHENGHVLFLDEPFAHLDARHARAVRQELRWLIRQNAAVILIVHDLNLAAQFCDRIIFLREGKMVHTTAAQGIYNPALLASVYGAEFAILRSGVKKYAVEKN